MPPGPPYGGCRLGGIHSGRHTLLPPQNSAAKSALPPDVAANPADCSATSGGNTALRRWAEMSPPSNAAQTCGLAAIGRRRHRFPPLCGGNLRPRGRILAAGADLHFVCPPWRPGIRPRRRFWGHFNGPKRLNPPPYWRSNFVCRQYLADLTAAARPSVPYGHTDPPPRAGFTL